MSNQRLETVDSLRGIAALAVCWFHLTAAAAPDVVKPGLLRASGTYGDLGVQVFFVISGFIIPYALLRGGYALRDYGRFVARRMLRLEPAYAAAIIATLLLDWVSSLVPGFRGAPFHLDLAQVAAHLTYTAAIAGYPWINAIFWTLAIEFQFYLLLGLLFPLLVSRRRAVPLIVLGALSAAAFALPQPQFAIHFMPLFVLGMATFLYRCERLDARVYVAVLCAASIAAASALSLPQAIAGALTAVTIAWIPLRSRVLLYFGSISYSLYLLHTQVAGRVLNLSLRLHLPEWATIGVVIAGVAAAIAAAHLFHRVIEVRWHARAARIRYRGAAEPLVVAADVVPA